MVRTVPYFVKTRNCEVLAKRMERDNLLILKGKFNTHYLTTYTTNNAHQL